MVNKNTKGTIKDEEFDRIDAILDPTERMREMRELVGGGNPAVRPSTDAQVAEHYEAMRGVRWEWQGEFDEFCETHRLRAVWHHDVSLLRLESSTGVTPPAPAVINFAPGFWTAYAAKNEGTRERARLNVRSALEALYAPDRVEMTAIEVTADSRIL